MDEPIKEHVTLTASLEEIERKLAEFTTERKLFEKEYAKLKQKISETDHEGLEMANKITQLIAREKLLKEEKKSMKQRLQNLNKEIQKFQDAEKKIKGET